MKSPSFALLLPVLVLGACARHEPPAAVPRPAVVMTIGSSPDAAWMVYSGEVRARHELDQSFRIGGKVVTRLVSLGDKIRKGQVLARLDPQDVQLSASASNAQVAAAEADLSLAQTELERARSLAANKFISKSVLDTRHTQVEAAQAKLKQAKAQANVSGNQVGYTTLLAERDGIVTALPVEAGQVVAAGQTVARIADPAEIEVLIWVPESRATMVKAGMAAFVRPWNAQGKTLAAEVREIAGSADATTRTYAVRVGLKQLDESLTLGSTAAVAFAAPSSASDIAIPLPALIKKGATPQVWLVDSQNKLQLRPVEVAEYRDEAAVIRRGLANGDRVVTVGAHTLTAGTSIRPIEQKAPVALDVAR